MGELIGINESWLRRKNWQSIDVDIIKETGFCQFANGINTPTKYGFLFSFLQPNSAVGHLYLSTDNRLFSRIYANDEWSKWKEYATK